MSLSLFNYLKNRLVYRGNRVYKKNPLLDEKISKLKKDGYLIWEDFIQKDILSNLQKRIKEEVEENFNIEFPCIAQTKINEVTHKEIINNYFRYTLEELEKFGITFGASEIKSYKSILELFRPSTLKIFIPNEIEFLNLWLHPKILEIVENYMGIKPFLQEAYIRRNFPAKYRVMNHFWHRDTNHKDFLIKVFFFFTDCKIENGPHEYIAGTIQDRRLDGKPYYSDEEVDKFYPIGSEKRICSVVKAGTIIIEDTRGLHRAIVPESGYRDLGYAVFTPQAIYNRWKEISYRVGLKEYEALDERQKKYLPKKFIFDNKLI